MFEEFICDLKVARKRAGLTQSDCGHLVGVSHDAISQIERGQRMPTIRELCALSLIYGRSFESLYVEVLREVREDLRDKLASMPTEPKDWPAAARRQQTVERLARRLLEETDPDHVG
ncbi:helix-turn-helix transcriptional regulator [Antarctobacter sp.]|uniref:helix-turn-helix transcriptional regulator n=1 Tax=Antarctobacter sp. TaxID=1872577 RepID=UPI002B2709B4|nr:helix-turn-helix transcriptional regulator [Antarctobacter sp.]